MPIQVKIGDKDEWIFPKVKWQTKKIRSSKMPVEFDKDFYIKTKKL